MSDDTISTTATDGTDPHRAEFSRGYRDGIFDRPGDPDGNNTYGDGYITGWAERSETGPIAFSHDGRQWQAAIAPGGTVLLTDDNGRHLDIPHDAAVRIADTVHARAFTS